MQERFEAPDVILYNVLLQSCSKSRDAEKALGIYEEMRMSQIQPQTITFALLIRCLSQRKEFYVRYASCITSALLCVCIYLNTLIFFAYMRQGFRDFPPDEIARSASQRLHHFLLVDLLCQ